MKMNWLSIPLLFSSAAFTAGAYADHVRQGQSNFHDYADVVAVEPVIKYVRIPSSRQECWNEEVPAYQAGYRSATPMIVGGIIGGAIGNKVVKGHKDLGIAAGALLGGSVARDLHQRHTLRHSAYSTVETRCQRVVDYHEEERVEGYRVTYRYKGETFTTRTNRDPGDRIRVNVSVKPVY